MRPRHITGSAGSRIKLLLGNTGSDYVLLLDEDDGKSEWQSTEWSCHGIPNGLLRQLNNISNKGRYVTYISCNLDGCWFVSGQKRDGTGSHSWWGGVDSEGSAAIKEWVGTGDRVHVFFGEDSSTWLIIQDNSSHWYSGNISDDLIKRIRRLYKKGKRIDYVNIFSSEDYFISDSEGTEWIINNSKPLWNEVKKGGNDPILSVLMAGDGSWIVIRPGRFSSSRGISTELTTKLSSFYTRHKQRQNARTLVIAEFDRIVAEREALRRQQEEQEAAQRRAMEEAALRRALEEQERKEKLQRLEESIKKKREVEDRAFQIINKRIKVGESVTVVGFSKRPGDAMVKRIGDSIEVGRADDNTSIVLSDPRKMVVYDGREEDVETINLLCLAVDKYEAAISLFHCKCRGDFCSCKKVFSAKVALQPSMAGTNSCSDSLSFSVGERVHVQGYADATIIPTDPWMSNQRIKVQYDDGTTYHVLKKQLVKLAQNFVAHHAVAAVAQTSSGNHDSNPRFRPLLEHRGEILKFDEYKCAEKIDFKALESILDDLREDTQVRKACLERLEKITNRTMLQREALKALRRCCLIESIVEDLYTILKDQPVDDDGCVVYEVEYEHRDVAFRGRRFARGHSIQVAGENYPRTATLQGMPGDLRAPLVGKFCHDIDCENSEVRLLCSLATQLGFEDLIPTLFDYRNRRQFWLSKIATTHGVSQNEAKRLPNIIISGGRYETWLRAMDQGFSPDAHSNGLKDFVFNLYAETRALRDQLVNHGRFRWTSIDRQVLEKDGKSACAIDTLLMSRIIQACENEVLNMIHRRFEDRGWRVRALVFDGLIAEPSSASHVGLEDLLEEAEVLCLSLGWDVRLVEKPLHGLHREPMTIVRKARDALHLAESASKGEVHFSGLAYEVVPSVRHVGYCLSVRQS